MTEEKKIKGRKRQLAVDVEGNLLQVFVHQANSHDSRAGTILAHRVLIKNRRVKKVVVDQGYRGFFKDFLEKFLKCKVEISPKIKGEFIIQPVRWIVERSIAWLNNARRLAKDFEQTRVSSENMIRIAAIALMLRQIVSKI